MLSSRFLAAVAITTALSWSVGAYAQNNPGSDKGTAQTRTEASQKNEKNEVKKSAEIAYGKVESYDPGKSISISEPPGQAEGKRSFDLAATDVTAKVPANVKVGDWVRVRETTNSEGHKTITVSPSSEKAATKAAGSTTSH